jgi:hypothetical protein
MGTLLRRYRSYLGRKAFEARPGIGLVEMQWQTVPWTAPLIVAIFICYWFGLEGVESLIVSLLLLAISMFGLLFVGWAFLTDGPVADYRRERQSEVGDE